MSSGQRAEFKNPVVSWIDERLPVFSMMQKEYGVFPTPRNFNYFWNFGAIAMVMLITMIVSGIVLAMHYTPHADHAFSSVERIMRDVNWGWMIRYIHMNGASFFFIAVYIHIFRGIYYGSYKKPRELLWILGVIIYLLMMATAFMGYTLPWSQMGGWAATVISGFFTAIPVVGDMIQTLLLGGFSVDNPTLNRFFSLHYLLPFLIFAVVFLHVWALHVSGSNNPLGIDVKGPQDTLPFHPYYTMKDTFGLGVFLLLYVIVTFFFPNIFAHPDHFVEYNPMVTPPHIVPEWYFLPFYAVLRGLTFGVNPYIGLSLFALIVVMAPVYCGADKKTGLCSIICVVGRKYAVLLLAIAAVAFALGYLSQVEKATGGALISLPLSNLVFVNAKLAGVLAMFGSVILLVFLPWLDTHPVRSARFRPLFKTATLLLAIDFVILGYVGMETADAALFGVIPLLWIGQLGTGYYFAYFLMLLPWLSRNEKAQPLPASINEAVLKA
ncbi:MAG: cytochrome b N-terminal domain-containing protein [Micavibrio aeruginosavorus]|uniref:Cytochrome b n=1 Tax=Micavibrio aeruginosavorus TaxID=349221 RepID=A0A7T5R1K2_9BACT|nr:MAG: cytochrome b N-terminal domain-containing protein [Micavibrio aeruginosavorus]